MPVLQSLLAFTQLNAPPVAVPDARANVLVYCPSACAPDDVQALRDTLERHYKLSWRLPRREATEAKVTLQVLPSLQVTPLTPGTLDLYSGALTAAERQALDQSPEVVLLAAAVPQQGNKLRKLKALDAAVATFATSQGGLVEDIDTLEVFTAERWTSARVQALGPPIQLWQQFTVVWSEDRSRVVTQGLRKLGMHELVMQGVTPDVEDDAVMTLVLVAEQLRRTDEVKRKLRLDVEALDNPQVRDWLRGWRVYSDDVGVVTPGTGVARVALRNAAPERDDPPGPLLEVGVPGDFGDEEALSNLLSTLWGVSKAASPPTAGQEPVSEPQPAAPAPPAPPDAQTPDSTPLAIPHSETPTPKGKKR